MKRNRRREDAPRRRRSGREKAAPQNVEHDELETLESIDELDTLEPVEEEELESLEELDAVPEPDPRVRASLGAEGDAVRISLDVDDLEKVDVGPAVEASLGALVAEHAAEVRWKDVVVEFGGDALIPSAAKAIVGEVLGNARARSATVQRGMGDERLFEVEPPTLQFRVERAGDGLACVAETDGLDAVDLNSLLLAEIDALAADAAGQRVALQIRGSAMPGTALVDQLAERLAAAGVDAFSLDTGGGARFLFDRALERAVTLTDADGARADVEVRVETSAERLAAVIADVLPKHRDRLTGRRVLLVADSALTDPLVEALRAFEPASIAVSSGGAVTVVWPALLHVRSKGGEVTVGVVAAGRDRADVFSGFTTEIAKHASTLGGMPAVVDWPAEFSLDADVSATSAALLDRGATRVSVSFGGDLREPLVPAPIVAEAAGTETRWVLDSDAGRPADLVRYLDRHAAALGDCRGHVVTIEVRGDGMVSRSLRAKLGEVLEAAGASVGRLDDRGETSVLFPQVATFDAAGGSDVMMTVSADTIPDAEVESLLAASIAEADLGDDATVHLRPTEHEAAVIRALAARGVARVVSADEPPVVLFPPLFAVPELDGERVRLTASPALEDDDALGAQVDHELASIADAFAGRDVLLTWDGARRPYSAPVERAIARLISAGPAKLELDNGHRARQLHPEIPREFVSVIGRRDAGDPPMVMLGIDASNGDGDIPDIEAALSAHDAADIDGRRVLILVRAGDEDVALAHDHAITKAIRAALEARVKALLFYGKSRSGTHFEVVSSSLEALPVGTKVRDPRS